MADHSEFWVLVGTAAPVLLVTNIVAWGQTNDLILKLGLAGEPAVKRTPKGGLRFRPLVVTLMALGTAVALNLAGLMVAMLALADEWTRASPVVGFFCIFGAAVATLAFLSLSFAAVKPRRESSAEVHRAPSDM